MDMNTKYGFVDNDGTIYTGNDLEFQIACRTKWRLSSPEHLLEVGYGHCWDQVELERDWFYKHGYQFKTLFICFELPYDNSYSTHTYLVYKENDKWHYFEHSDFNNRGIHTFDILEDAIAFQRKKHIESNQKRNPVGKYEVECLHIYEYDNCKYGFTMKEFMDYVFEKGAPIKIKETG